MDSSVACSVAYVIVPIRVFGGSIQCELDEEVNTNGYTLIHFHRGLMMVRANFFQIFGL